MFESFGDLCMAVVGQPVGVDPQTKPAFEELLVDVPVGGGSSKAIDVCDLQPVATGLIEDRLGDVQRLAAASQSAVHRSVLVAVAALGKHDLADHQI